MAQRLGTVTAPSSVLMSEPSYELVVSSCCSGKDDGG
ncbi:predicted protein [Chaetomium globosum CBS 148.51]|uniref:Uncharacterized protein n=1 Tax=Chaetomium globosum (strain ATCC 6205 / CBS 148.51 / DSM 1962 / NBRC 6347 / NRRL 1970) TaxID=306901 RepID=Q2GQQ3_CHAGB|nr:uncharacterized protein CHGG_09701 [Chaetomium globosum CBS 148.51]EAQ83297.1 predicted protein [Chaetomium globosum CBS 148.51]